jgi:hypothetical protein
VFRWSLGLTVGLVAASVAALAFTGALVDLPSASLLLVVAVVWFIVCLVSYGVLIYRALD